MTNGGVKQAIIHEGDMDMWSFDANKGVFFSGRRRHTISYGDCSSDVCSSDLPDGRLLDSQAGYGAAEIAVTATNTGTFTVVVADADLCCNGSIADTEIGRASCRERV